MLWETELLTSSISRLFLLQLELLDPASLTLEDRSCWHPGRIDGLQNVVCGIGLHCSIVASHCCSMYSMMKLSCRAIKLKRSMSAIWQNAQNDRLTEVRPSCEQIEERIVCRTVGSDALSLLSMCSTDGV